MAGSVVFEKIDKVLPLSSGQFTAIFGAIYELYLDKDKAPDIAADLRPMLGGTSLGTIRSPTTSPGSNG